MENISEKEIKEIAKQVPTITECVRNAGKENRNCEACDKRKQCKKELNKYYSNIDF